MDIVEDIPVIVETHEVVSYSREIADKRKQRDESGR
jgi:hypothetical protein